MRAGYRIGGYVAILMAMCGSITSAETVAVRKLYDPDVVPEAQPTAISRNCDIEHVSTSGTLRKTRQWSGATRDEGAMSRNWSANTIVVRPGLLSSISMAGWDIEEGIDVDGVYEFYPKWQQDGHLRFGYLAVDHEALGLADGQGFSLDGVFPYDAVVVDLSFRIVAGGAPAWQTTWYAGTPVQSGIWQVPAGMTFSEAQADEGNRLAEPWFLNGTTPDTPMSFILQARTGGVWRLRIDLLDTPEKDDIIVASHDSSSNSRPATLAGVDESSGLMISTIAAGGSGWPKVGRTPIDVQLLNPAPIVRIAPASGPVPLTHTTDISVMWTGGNIAKGAVYLDGEYFPFGAAESGAFDWNDGRTVRLPGVSMSDIGKGIHTISVELTFPDNTVVTDEAEWNVIENSE